MPVLPTKLTELGRIRIGDRGGTRQAPRKLDAFRLTSTNKPRLHAAAELFGGEVTVWEDAPEGRQWQLYTTVDALPVTVPPFHSFSQHDEAWQGGLCLYRCNGQLVRNAVEELCVGVPCLCARLRAPLPDDWQPAGAVDEAFGRLHRRALTIDTISRLNLLLPDLPGVGVWRFETGSYYAGMELQGQAALLERASAEDCFIRCTLQLETRKVRRLGEDGTAMTRVFPIVTLQPDISLAQLLTRQIPAPQRVGLPAPAPPPTREQAQQLIAETYGAGGGPHGASPPPAAAPAPEAAPDAELVAEPEAGGGALDPPRITALEHMQRAAAAARVSMPALLAYVQADEQTDAGWDTLSLDRLRYWYTRLSRQPSSVRMAMVAGGFMAAANEDAGEESNG